MFVCVFVHLISARPVHMKVRALKAAKGDKDAVKALVDQLMALKVEYKDKAGKDYGAPAGGSSAPAPAGGGEKKEAKKEAKKEVKKEAAPAAPVAAQPPAVPVLPPAYTTPAPRPPVRVPAGADEVAALEAKLAVYAYAGGFRPSREDARLLTGDNPSPFLCMRVHSISI